MYVLSLLWFLVKVLPKQQGSWLTVSSQEKPCAKCHVKSLTDFMA